MSLQHENLFLDNWVPNINVMIQTSRENEFVICIPLERIDAFLVIGVSGLELHIPHRPQNHISIKRARCYKAHLRNRKQISDSFCVLKLQVQLVLAVFGFVPLDLCWHCDIVDMDLVEVHACREKSVDSGAAPLETQLNFRRVESLSPHVVVRIPEVYCIVVLSGRDVLSISILDVVGGYYGASLDVLFWHVLNPVPSL